MAMQSPADPSPVSPWRLQFELRSLFAVTTALAVFLGLVKWKGPITGVVFLLVVGIALIVAGIRTKRRGRKVAGVLVIVASLSFGVWASLAFAWVGHKTFLVPIEIRDADTGKPIPNAAVRLLDHSTPAASPTILTDAKGMARVPAQFMTSGMDTAFEKRDWISFRLCILEVNAVGHRPFRQYLGDQVGVSGWDLYTPLPVVCVQLQADTSPPVQSSRRAE